MMSDAYTHLAVLHDASNRRLLEMLPPEQLERVFASEMCDIEPDFLGFVGIYDRLAQIIPLEWSVIDLGCAYAPQSFFFQRHKQYVGVDLITAVEARFAAENSRHWLMPIAEFIASHGAEYDRKTTFAICSYVPPWHGDNMQSVREAFQNVFTFYPGGSGKIIIDMNGVAR